MSTTTDLSPPVDAEAARDTALGDGAPPTRRTWSVAPLLLRLHFYAGILIAPFLVVAALTGLGFVFTPQLDQVIYAHELYVDQVQGTARPLAEQVAAAIAVHPAGAVGSVVPPASEDATTKVVFIVDGIGDKQHTVYVDPYTNQVRGTLVTWWGETPVMTWFDDLHRNLLLGDVGRHYSELAASWLWVVTLGGVVLWLRRQRGRRIRATVLPDLSAKKGVRRTRGWHAATGVWLTVGLLILSATGLTWSRYAGANFTAVLDTVNGHKPELVTAVDSGGAAGGGHHGGEGAGPVPVDLAAVDQTVATARTAGLSGPIEVAVPMADRAWTVTQTDNVWPVHLDRVAVDPSRHTVTARSDFTDWPLLAQLSKLGVQAHMGYLFGLVNQLLLAALGIGLLCVIVWGYRMWWQRRPTRVDRHAIVGIPPARGGWMRLPAVAIAIGVPVVFAIGWALPMLGLSLVAFLAADLIVGAVRRRAVPVVATSPAPTGS
jgi:uncharacterized iron-regulated membrane protein